MERPSAGIPYTGSARICRSLFHVKLKLRDKKSS